MFSAIDNGDEEAYPKQLEKTDLKARVRCFIFGFFYNKKGGINKKMQRSVFAFNYKLYNNFLIF